VVQDEGHLNIRELFTQQHNVTSQNTKPSQTTLSEPPITHVILTLHFKATNTHIAMSDMSFVTFSKYCNFIQLYFENNVKYINMWLCVTPLP